MAELLIDGLDEAVVGRLEQRASAFGLDLEEYARSLLTREAEAYAIHLAELAEIQRGQPPQATDSTDLIRDARDTGYSTSDGMPSKSGKWHAAA